MGCSGSRLDPTASDEVPARIRPLLRRRLEEIKKRSHASVLKGTQTLSKKELLKHGSDGEETENDISMRSAKVAPDPSEENKEVICEENPGENDVREEKEGDEKEEKEEKVSREEKVIEMVSAGKSEEEEEEEEEEKRMLEDKINADREGKEEGEEEEEGRLSNYDESMICPGSPSFRVYCIDAFESDRDDEGKDEGTNEKKEMVDEGEGINSGNGPMEKTEKKGKKGLRLGRVLPKGSPGKYLFNVKSCYSPGCMGNHHSRLLQEKSIA